jgi:hypothetical protein
LYRDPSRSNLIPSSMKYDKAAVSSSQAPYWSPLMVVALTQLSVSSGNEDGDSATARIGTSSAPPSASPVGRTRQGSLLISHCPQSRGSLL